MTVTDVKWIKLKVGMFDGESFKKIKRAKIGGEKFRDKLTAIWFELMDFAGKCNHSGAFINSKEIPYTDLEDIATMIDREPEELQLCMAFYVKEGMVEIIDDVYMLSNWSMYQNEAGLEKLREQRRIAQAKWRAKQKALSVENPIPENDAEDPPESEGIVDITVDSTEHIPSYSYSNSISTISNNSDSLNSLEIEGGMEGERDGTPPPAPPAEKGKKGRKKAEVQQPPADFSGTTFSPAMIAEVEKWLKYKTERRDIYQPTGLQSLISKIQNNVNKYGEKAVAELIETCMASNWSGIIFDKLQPQAPQQHYQGGAGRRNVPPHGADRLLEMIDRGDFDE